MFNSIKNIIKNTQKLTDKYVFFEVYSDNEVKKIIIDLNRIDQLFYGGVNVNNKDLPTYSQNRGYAKFDGITKEKAKGVKYTLVDKQDFYNSFKVFVKGDAFVIQANDKKNEYNLTELYGNGAKIIGLTDESISKLSKKTIQFIIDFCRKEILHKH